MKSDRKKVDKETIEKKTTDKKELNTKKLEHCICCHIGLDIPVDLELDYRSFYVEGAGQLCYDCYHKIYRSKGVIER